MSARMTELWGRGPAAGRRICKSALAAGHGFAKSLSTFRSLLKFPPIFEFAFASRAAAQRMAAPRSLSAINHTELPISPRALFSSPIILFLALFTASQAAAAPGEWNDFATVSMTDPQTPKLTTGGICWSDGTNILCDGTAGLASGGGTTSDRIISGTTSVTANTTGYISFTTAGTTTGYMNTAGNFILPGVSATSTVSATNFYAANAVGIGAAPQTGYGLYVTNTIGAATRLRSGNGSATSPAYSFISDGNSGVYLPAVGNLAFTTSSTEAVRIVSTGYVGIGTSAPLATLQISGTTYLTGNLGIGAAPGSLPFSLTSTNALLGLTGNGYQWVIGVGNGGTYTSRNFTIRDASGSANRLTIVSSSGNVGIGTDTPNAALEVSGTVSATGLVVNGVTFTGAGAAGVTSLASLTTDVSLSIPGGNLFLGSISGATAGTGGNTAVGIDTLAKSGATGSNNSALGNGALKVNASGASNVAIGNVAMRNNTSGGSNAALGYAALYTNSTGANNVAIGNAALYLNTTGSYNTVVGSQAANGGVGSIISRSTIIGYAAGNGLTTAQSNTLIGYQTGYYLTSGSNNILIGTAVQAQAPTSSNALNIGNGIYGDLTNASTFNALIGINIATPTTALEVSGTVSATAFYTSGTVRVGGNGGESCSTPADYGKNRYNPVSGRMQVCVPR